MRADQHCKILGELCLRLPKIVNVVQLNCKDNILPDQKYCNYIKISICSESVIISNNGVFKFTIVTQKMSAEQCVYQFCATESNSIEWLMSVFRELNCLVLEVCTWKQFFLHSHINQNIAVQFLELAFCDGLLYLQNLFLLAF